ncbi:hypothetical protein F441_04085 [Phytophthora nicotianae CJ01A1]|uniref:Uncharacterized protein n=1 Tax=Phytophthora nicotianae CJ01A1 TaxID=1317063 RepID=W2XJ74_PHYNI|nr:hypothetical protein F441_04085 [Phytophthora nicotianae CJ01A1]
MDTLMQVMRVRGSRMKSHVPLADYPIPEAHEPDDIYVLVVLTPPPKASSVEEYSNRGASFTTPIVTIKQQEKELAVVWSTLDWAVTE